MKQVRSFHLSVSTIEALKNYSTATEIPQTRIVERAIADYLESRQQEATAN